MTHFKRFTVLALIAGSLAFMANTPASATVRSVSFFNLSHHRIFHSSEWLLRVNLHNRHLRLQPALAGNVLNGPRVTVPALGRRTGAIAGVNGDFFNYPYSGSLHGLVKNGVVYHIPGPNRTSNFYTTPDGRAHIGRVTYNVSLKWTDNGRAHTMKVAAVDNTDDMNKRRLLVWVTPHLATVGLVGCSVAYAHRVDAGWKFSYVVHNVTKLVQRTTDQRALVSCGAPTLNALLGVTISPKVITAPFTVDALLSGGTQLIRNGVRFHDPYPQLWDTARDPSTFMCVSRDGWHVIIGTIDGRTSRSWGVTYPQLQRNMRNLGCWNGMTFDGGGSTTMYYKNHVWNTPSQGALRPVPNGLFLYRR